MNTYQRTARRIAAALSQSKLVAAKLALVLFVSACQPFLPMAEEPAELSLDAPAYAVHDPSRQVIAPMIVLFPVRHPINSTPKQYFRIYTTILPAAMLACMEQAAATRTPNQPTIYQIRLKGQLGQQWSAWFADMTITLQDNGETLLEGPVVDQAALHGLLRKVRDLGLPLLAVACKEAHL